jgi:uncharacterized protein YjbI with pentapeptide repeats
MKRTRYEWDDIFRWLRERNGGALNLDGANLRRADLVGTNLVGANLDGAYLVGANLREANLRHANLYRANLRHANLYRANLYGANLYRANLYGANLVGAYLYGATMNWSSHDLIAERLRQAAEEDPIKRVAAGYVLISRNWCWRELLTNAPDITLDDGTTLKRWTLETMRSWVKAGDYAPLVLRDNAEVA